MENRDINEIAKKLNLTVEEISMSSTIQDTYYEIKNNPNLSNDDKEAAYSEMASIYKGMLQNKKK